MKKIIPVVLICTYLFSCDRISKNKTEVDSADQDMSLAKLPSSNGKELLPKEIDSDSSATTNSNILQGTLPGQNPDWDKKIIKTAELKLEVKDFKTCSNIVHIDSKHYGAYIASEDQNE